MPAARSPALDARLVQVALDILDREGLEALSLRRIARGAGVSHGAPLRHFRSLADLRAEVAAHGFRLLSESVVKSGAQLLPGAGPLARLRSAALAYVEAAVAHAGLFGLMFRTGDLDWSNTSLQQHAGAAFEHLVFLVRAAQDAGWQEERDTRVLAAAVWASVHGVATLWSQGALAGPLPRASLEDALSTTLELLLRDPTGGPE